MTPFEANLIVAGVSIVLGCLIGGLIAWFITHRYYRKQKKDSEQQIRRLEETLDKILNTLNTAENLLAKFENVWKAEFPGQLIPPKIIAVFTDVIKRTATALTNYDYTAKGGIKLWGEAGTILGDPEGEIPPIIDDR